MSSTQTIEKRLRTQENILLDTVARYNKILKKSKQHLGYGSGQLARLKIHMADTAHRIIVFNNAMMLNSKGN